MTDDMLGLVLRGRLAAAENVLWLGQKSHQFVPK